MINKIKISKSEKIILCFVIILGVFTLTSLIILKNKCLFVKNYDPNKIKFDNPENIAILVRASHQMRAFEDRFMTIGLPYRVIGGPRFYERAEIRDAMAYFRAAISKEDGLALQRIINK